MSSECKLNVQRALAGLGSVLDQPPVTGSIRPSRTDKQADKWHKKRNEDAQGLLGGTEPTRSEGKVPGGSNI